MRQSKCWSCIGSLWYRNKHELACENFRTSNFSYMVTVLQRYPVSSSFKDWNGTMGFIHNWILEVCNFTARSPHISTSLCCSDHTTTVFMAIFPGPLRWAGTRRELLDFMVQGKINRGRHTDNPAGRHSIWTNQCPPPPSPIFYRPDALPATQPTTSKHWRQLAHWD